MTIGQIINISLKRLKNNWLKYAIAFLLLSLPTIVGYALNYAGSALVEYNYGYTSADIVEYYNAYLVYGSQFEGVDYELICQAYKLSLLIESVPEILSAIGVLCFSLPLAFYFVKAVNQTCVSVKEACRFIVKSIPLTLLMFVKILAWTLLLIVPGIIKAFAYSQAYYVKAENPEMSANECIKRSEDMMKGRKGKYFLLMLAVAVIAGIASSVGEIVLAVVSMLFVYFYGTIAYYIVGGVLSFVVTAVVAIGVGVFSNMMEAVFYVDTTRSYRDKIEQELRAYHESSDSSSPDFGSGFKNRDPFADDNATNRTHANPFDDNNGNSDN